MENLRHINWFCPAHAGVPAMSWPSRMRRPASSPTSSTGWGFDPSEDCGEGPQISPVLNSLPVFHLQEIHALKAQLEAAKYDVIKYCIGTLVSITAVGLAVIRILMWGTPLNREGWPRWLRPPETWGRVLNFRRQSLTIYFCKIPFGRLRPLFASSSLPASLWLGKWGIECYSWGYAPRWKGAMWGRYGRGDLFLLL